MEKTAILLLLATGLSACSLPAVSPAAGPSAENIKLDLAVEINGESFDGIFAVPAGKQVYKIKPRPIVADAKGDFFLSTCHRDVRFQKSYEYEPNAIESTSYCPIILTYPGEDRRRGLADLQEAFIDFGDEDVQPPGFLPTLYCNGNRALVKNGAAVCQGKAGTVQDILFASPVDFGTPAASTCSTLKILNDSRARITLAKGYCVYVFKNKESGKVTRLTTYGYESWRR